MTQSDFAASKSSALQTRCTCIVQTGYAPRADDGRVGAVAEVRAGVLSDAALAGVSLAGEGFCHRLSQWS
jgi:hypothetical protein